MAESRHLIDPELVAGLEFFPAVELGPDTLAEARRGVEAMADALAVPASAVVAIEQRTLPTAAGHGINVLLFRPRLVASSRPALLHLHGGGYVMGSARLNMASNQELAARLDSVIVSVDYRLAPESPHPGPVEDCYAALKWLHQSAGRLGIDQDRIAVMGESAGGGLAAALALLARDRGEVPLLHQHLIYPMLDDRTCTAEVHPYTGEFVWTAGANRFGWASLLGHEPGGQDVSPYAAAARATDLSGLPDTFISVGALDLFVDENVEYARRLVRAGVPTELHVYPGAFHAFDMIPGATLGEAARRASEAALRRVLSGAQLEVGTRNSNSNDKAPRKPAAAL